MPAHTQRIALIALLTLATACSGNRPPAATSPMVNPDARLLQASADSAARAARTDSMRAAAQADSVGRRERAAAARADAVRAQVARGDVEGPGGSSVDGGLDAATLAMLTDRLHFAFDRSDLVEGDRERLSRKADILRRGPQLTIEIAGHCDERGSDEYNLALGLRRAAAAKQYLVELGIADERISIVSYGRERPLDTSGTEEAFAANRRAEFSVTGAAR